MNLLKRTDLFEKLYRTLDKYSTLTTSSIFRKGRNTHIDGLLQTRFRNFLERTDGKNDKNNSSTENPKFHPQTLELSNVIDNSNSKCEKNPSEYDEIVATIENVLLAERCSRPIDTLRPIDDSCCKLLGRLSQREILHILHLLVRTGLNITKLKLYRSSLLALRKYLERDRLSVGETLQLLFFEGLGKKLAKRNVRFLLNFLPPLSDLSLMEKCVVAHTTFKCQVALKANDARSLEEALENNAAELAKDPQILSTICKAVSYAGTSVKFSLANLSREIVENDELFGITTSAHILSLYVEANHENLPLTRRLFRDSMISIYEDREKLNSVSVRIKDVDKLVWALSMLNYKLGEADKKEISLFVHRRYKEFETKPFLLVNTLLALWILDCRLYKIIEKCLINRVFQSVNEHKLWKQCARLHLLLNCIKIESPEIKLSDELFETRKVGMKVGKSVTSLARTINELSKKLDMGETTIDCPVDGIYIAGVSLRSGKKLIHVDVLNETTCFKGTNVPRGLTNLKIRLLDKIGIHSILIAEEHLNDVEFISSTITRCIEDTRDTSDSREKNFSQRDKEKVKISKSFYFDRSRYITGNTE